MDFQQLAAPRKNALQKSGIPKMGHILIKCTFSKPHHFWGPPAFSLRGFRKTPTNFSQQIHQRQPNPDPDLLVFVHRLSVRELFSWTWRSTKPTRKVLRIRGIRTSKNFEGWTVGLSGSSCFPMFFSAALKCCKERGWFSWENWEG